MVSFQLATSIVTLVLVLTISITLSEALADSDFQVGEIKWLQDRYVITDKATVQLIDSDLNQDSNVKDEVEISVWSYTDVPGIDIILTETGLSTGVFEGIITITDTDYSDESGNILRITISDDIVAKYEDTTLPIPPYLPSDRLSISDRVYVGEPLPEESTSRILLHDPAILEENRRDKAASIEQGKNYYIFVHAQNNSVQNEQFVHVMDIFDSQGEKIKTLSGNDSNRPGDDTYGGLRWTPDRPGNYYVEISVIDFNDNSIILSSPVRFDFTVISEINENKEQIVSDEIKHNIAQKTIPSFVDSNKDPQYYLDRYYNEQKYKAWFDNNYPDYTIEEAVGLPRISENTISNNKLPEWVRNIFIWYAENRISEDELLESIEFLIKYKIIQVDNS